ncbi:MAG: putative polysaccharide biosynthesis protein [Limnochordia bacterium]|jgi:stage V sporulation protein B
MVRNNAFLRGAFILAAAGAVSRLLGVFYLIPLPRIIHDEGMGLLQMVRPIYYFAFVVSVAGLPVAVSKLVAEKAALGDVGGIHSIFRLALGIMILLGSLSTLALYGAARWLTENILQDPGAYGALVAIAPSVLLLALIAAFRGFFHGLQYMTPSAVAQVGEQIVRVVATLALAYYCMPMGVEKGAAGASLGSVFGAAVGVLVFLAYYFPVRRRLLAVAPKRQFPRESNGVILYKLVSLAWPVILGAVLLPLMQMIDAALVPSRLRLGGLSVEQVREWYGYLGMALNMMGIPAVVTVALAASIVPAIAEGLALGSRRIVRHRTQEAVRVTILVGLPAAVGLYTLASEISYLLFGYPQVGIPLSILSLATLAQGLYQTTAGILQGLGEVFIPVQHLLAGTLCKLITNYYLISLPEMGIKGAAWGTSLGFSLAAILNLGAVQKLVGYRWEPGAMILKPSLAVGAMYGMVKLIYGFIYTLGLHYGSLWSLGSNLPFWANAAATMAAVIGGAATYFCTLLILGGIRPRDLELIPRYGPWLVSRLQKWGLLNL